MDIIVDLTEQNVLVDDRLSLSIIGLSGLNHYLISHEDDIAMGINDFGCLRPIFFDLLNREPSEF